MERTILIANSKTQQRYNIKTTATTLGELKTQMRAQGIDYEDMDFTEGITKTHLISDESVLPTNVTYKGAPTNNLIILLTNTKKKIASGGIPLSRGEFSNYIKKNNLGDAIKEAFGDNWTRVSTANLLDFFRNNDKTSKENLDKVRQEVANINQMPSEETPSEAVSTPDNSLPDVKSAPHAGTVEWLYNGIKTMCNEHTLYTDDIIVLASLTQELAKRLKEEEHKFTDDEINEMMESI